MANPTISFRLNQYQIARGLDIILKHVPTYKPSSISNIVKICYLDYIAKMGHQTSLNVSQKAANEVKGITTSLDPLHDILSQLKTSDINDEIPSDTKASSDDVNDFFNNLDKEE